MGHSCLTQHSRGKMAADDGASTVTETTAPADDGPPPLEDIDDGPPPLEEADDGPPPLEEPEDEDTGGAGASVGRKTITNGKEVSQGSHAPRNENRPRNPPRDTQEGKKYAVCYQLTGRL